MSGATLARSAARAYARADVVSVCRASGDRCRSTRRFCAGACSRAAWRVLIPIAHQRRIRERCPAIWRTSIVRRSNIRLGDGDHRPLRAARFDTVRAEGLLGLRTPSGELAGVAVFTRWPVPESGDLYGPEHRNLVVCLTRGACVHWAHPHAASFLISRACSRQKSSSAGRFSTAMPTQLAGELFRIDPLGSPRVGASAVVMRQR